MKHCNVLTKLRHVPEIFTPFLRDGDILFRAHGIFVVVDNDSFDEEPYEVFNEIEMVRLDKRILQEFNDPELAVIIFRARIERDLYQITQDRDVITETADDILLKRYPTSLLDSIDEKLSKIYNQVND